MDAAVSHSYYIDGYEKYLDGVSDLSFLLYVLHYYTYKFIICYWHFIISLSLFDHTFTFINCESIHYTVASFRISFDLTSEIALKIIDFQG